jgi:8-oxo-dGTP diphosphatase
MLRKSPEVKVGIGILIFNEEGKILIGQRRGAYGEDEYSIPGGKLDVGETFEEAAIREVQEETSLTIDQVQVISISNNLSVDKYQDQWVTVHLKTDQFRGQPKVTEETKCNGWQWCDLVEIPEPQFEMSREAIKCYQKNKFY